MQTHILSKCKSRSPQVSSWLYIQMFAVAFFLPLWANSAPSTQTYDSLNRLTSITYADGSRIEYRFDANGNRTMHRTEPPQLRATVYPMASEVPGTVGSVVLDVTANGPREIHVSESLLSVTPSIGSSDAEATLDFPQRSNLLLNQNF